MRQIRSFLVFALLALPATVAAQEAAVPHFLNFQSVLRDDGGNLITDSFIDLEFKILDQDGQEVYHELQPGVQVVRSAVNVMIGEGVDPNSTSVPKGGVPLAILDPTTGPKFLQMKIGDNLPSDPMEFSAIPYSYWAEKALTVPNESIGSEQIKDGSIKVQDLAPELTFGDINGTASDGQIPTTIATDAELNAHISSTTAHPASAITITGSFNFTSTPTAQSLLTGLDTGLAGEIFNRQTDRTNLQNQITTLQTATSDINNIPGTLSESKIDSTIARDSEVAAAITTAEADDLTTSTNFGGDVSGTYNAISVANDSHNHTGSTISGLSTSDFSSANISQWTNDSGYLTTTTGDSRYVNVTGDTMTGALNMGGNNITNVGTGSGIGFQVADHETRITALEGVTPKIVLSADIDGSTGALNAGYGVGSVTRVSTGLYTITFATPMPNANYVVVGSGEEDGPSEGVIMAVTEGSKTTTGFGFRTVNMSDTHTDTRITLAVISIP
jgi:hypothetical protein